MDDCARPLEDGVVFPGHGIAFREAQRRLGAKATNWARLTQSQPTGGRAVILYDNTVTEPQIAGTPFLDLGGADDDATQMQIVIDAPRVIERSFVSLQGEPIQLLTGEYDNIEIGSGDFPGLLDPIRWPPLSVLIEWGTLTRTRMLVDMINGCRVNVTASAVRAWAVITDDAANNPGTSAAYAVRAFATPGWPTQQVAQRTVWLGTVVNNDASEIFPIPLRARQATVVGTSITNPPAVTVAYIRFYQDPAGAHGAGTFLINANQPIPFPIPNGAAYFDVINSSGADVDMAALFPLDG